MQYQLFFSFFQNSLYIVRNGEQFPPALYLLLQTIGLLSFALCISIFFVFCVLAPRLLEPVGCLLHKLWDQSAAMPSVPAGGILFLNIILSPVPKQYLSRSRYSINVSANNDQFSLQTQKTNFSISLGFLHLIQTLTFLLTSDCFDFHLHICILNIAALFYMYVL